MSTLKNMSFSKDEYRTRVSKTQKVMVEQNLDALLCHNFTNICYLTGLQTFGHYEYFMAVIPAEGEPVLLGSKYEMFNALVSAWTDDNVTYDPQEDPIEATKKLLINRGLDDKRLGIEKNHCCLAVPDYVTRLKNAMPKTTFIDATNVVERVKVIKSPAEIEYVRQAGKLSSSGMQAAIDVVAEGKTDNDLAAAATQAMIESGSEYMCLSPVVTVGKRSGIPHTTHYRQKIAHGDNVFMEMAACIHRYSAPIMRTVVIGPPSDKVKRTADACIRCLNTVIETLESGVSSHEVAVKAYNSWKDDIKGLVWHGSYCYSIGLGFPPTWADCKVYVNLESDYILQPGMLFHVCISLRDPGKFGCAFSETVIVREKGCEVLTDVPRQLIIK